MEFFSTLNNESQQKTLWHAIRPCSGQRNVRVSLGFFSTKLAEQNRTRHSGSRHLDPFVLSIWAAQWMQWSLDTCPVDCSANQIRHTTFCVNRSWKLRPIRNYPVRWIPIHRNLHTKHKIRKKGDKFMWRIVAKNNPATIILCEHQSFVFCACAEMSVTFPADFTRSFFVQNAAFSLAYLRITTFDQRLNCSTKQCNGGNSAFAGGAVTWTRQEEPLHQEILLWWPGSRSPTFRVLWRCADLPGVELAQRAVGGYVNDQDDIDKTTSRRPFGWNTISLLPKILRSRTHLCAHFSAWHLCTELDVSAACSSFTTTTHCSLLTPQFFSSCQNPVEDTFCAYCSTSHHCAELGISFREPAVVSP